MMRQPGTVLSSDEHGVLIDTRRHTVCSGCAARSACGTAALDRFFGQRRRQLKIRSGGPLRNGDVVTLEMDERALLSGSALVYGLPLAGLLIGASAGAALAGEVGAVVAGFACLAAGLGWARNCARHMAEDPRFHPRVSPCGNVAE